MVPLNLGLKKKINKKTEQTNTNFFVQYLIKVKEFYTKEGIRYMKRCKEEEEKKDRNYAYI